MRKHDAYRYAEKCLYDYPANSAKLSALSEELELLRGTGDVRGHVYEVGCNVRGSHSDPVSSYVEKIENTERRIKELKRYVGPVRRLISDLTGPNVLARSKNEDYRRILELYYFGGNSAAQVISQLNWSKSMFYERKKRLVAIAMVYMGF